MKTICVDTNVLARFIYGAQDELGLKSREVISGAQKGLYLIYVDQVVIAELVWVFTSYYKFTRKEIGDVLLQLVGEEFIQVEKKNSAIRALVLYQDSNFGFADCWLLAISSENDYEMVTFDKKLGKVK